MALSYKELTQPPTEDELFTTLLELATLAEFPATSWQSGSVPLSLLQVEKTELVKLATLVADIGKGGLLDEATLDWLTLFAISVFDEERVPAVKTLGLATLTCSALAGPYTIAVGQLVATNAGGKQFRNTTGGTLASGGTLQLTFEAEEAGAASNIGSGTLTILLTPLAGVTIANPAVPPSSTWITRSGADEETDAQLRARCRAKWATLGTGATADSYAFWAREASAEVRRVKVLEHSNAGAPTDGHVTLYLAAEIGTVSAQAVADVIAYITPRKPLCTTLHVFAATAVPTSVAAVQHVRADDRVQAESELEDFFDEFEASLEIGETIYLVAITEQLMRPVGMRNTVVSAPAGDVGFDVDEVAVIDTSGVTWVEI